MSDDRQFTIEDLQKEIEKELGLPEGFGYEPKDFRRYPQRRSATLWLYSTETFSGIFSIIARQIAETRKLLNGWVKATKRKPK